MPVWHFVLKLSDIFHDDDLELEDKRDEIVRRIRNAPFFNEDDFELSNVLDELEIVPDEDHFNDVWYRFYDWADDHRVWVETL